MKPVYPMLAQTGSLSDYNSDLHYIEPKLDGIRCLAVHEHGQTRLFNRNLVDITDRFPEVNIHPAARNCILDGELVCTAFDGEANFQAIQTRANRIQNISEASLAYPAILMIFDIVFCNDAAVGKFPAVWRRDLLSQVLPSNFIVPELHAAEALAREESSKGEGVMLKAKQGLYTPGLRSRAWLKAKWHKERIVYIKSMIPGIGKRAATFGAVRITDREGRDLGKVGTGFTDSDLTMLKAYNSVRGIPIKVRYNDTTNDGKLRFPRFISFSGPES